MDPSFASNPLGSLRLVKDPQQREKYLEGFLAMPFPLARSFDNPAVGAFIRGSAKRFNIPVEQAPQISLAVFRAALGEIPLAKLGVILSAELKLPNDKAQSLAKELEKELFTPIMLEFNAFLKRRGQNTADKGRQAHQAGAKNIVDLKDRK